MEEFLKQKILTQEELENNKRINKKFNDWMNFFNIYVPFNVIMKYGSLYLNLVTEMSDNKTLSQGSSETAELKIVKIKFLIFLICNRKKRLKIN